MTEPSTYRIPQFDQADRMRKSLRDTAIGVQEMADYLEVSRNTVSTWINGRVPPSSQTLRLWAMRCGVPLEWLRDGIDPDPGDAPRQYSDVLAAA